MLGFDASVQWFANKGLMLQIQALPLKLTFGPVAIPLIKLLPLKPVYIIETILSVSCPLVWGELARSFVFI